MSRHGSLRRFAALGVVGGCLLQVTGCVAGIAPVLASFAESALLSYLVPWLVNP